MGNFYYPDIVLDQLVVSSIDENSGEKINRENTIEKLSRLIPGSEEQREINSINNAENIKGMNSFSTNQERWGN